jgi:hypothetical protein
MGALIKGVCDRWFVPLFAVPADSKRRYTARRSLVGQNLCVGDLGRALMLSWERP